MNIKEIIFRPSPQQITVEEMCFVVQEYINEKKGQIVLINIYKDLVEGMPNILRNGILNKELQLLSIAYDTSIEYYSNKFK